MRQRVIVFIGAALVLASSVPAGAASEPGERVWSDNPTPITQEMVVAGSKVIVAGTYTDYSARTGIETTALHRRTGERLWTYRFGLAAKTTVTDLRASEDGERVYVRGRTSLGGGVALDRLAAISVDSGTEFWEITDRVKARWKPAEILPFDGLGYSVLATFTRPERTAGAARNPMITDGPDCRIVSHGGDGDVLWAQRYPTTCSVGDASFGRLMLAGTRTVKDTPYNIRQLVTWSVDPSDGSVRWRTAHRTQFGLDWPQDLKLSPDGRAGLVIEGLSPVGFKAWLVGSAAGRIRWRTPILDFFAGSSAWAPDGRSVYLTGNDPRGNNEPAPRTQAMNAETGKIRWAITSNGFGDARAVAATANGVYASSLRRFRVTLPGGEIISEYQARVLAYSPQDGASLWSANYGSRGEFTDPAVAKPLAGIAVDPSRPRLLFMGGSEDSQGYVVAFRAR